jgi:hypothetical protein
MMSQEGQLADLAERWREATAERPLASLAQRTAEVVRTSWTGSAETITELVTWLDDIANGEAPSTARIRSIYVRLEKIKSSTPTNL